MKIKSVFKPAHSTVLLTCAHAQGVKQLVCLAVVVVVVGTKSPDLEMWASEQIVSTIKLSNASKKLDWLDFASNRQHRSGSPQILHFMLINHTYG